MNKPNQTKQKELPGMPPKTPFDLNCEFLLGKYEEMAAKKREVGLAKQKVLNSMKKAKRFTIRLKDSDGIMRRIAYKETEGITIVQDGRE